MLHENFYDEDPDSSVDLDLAAVRQLRLLSLPRNEPMIVSLRDVNGRQIPLGPGLVKLVESSGNPRAGIPELEVEVEVAITVNARPNDPTREEIEQFERVERIREASLAAAKKAAMNAPRMTTEVETALVRAIYRERAEGSTLEDIALDHGISRYKVAQYLKGKLSTMLTPEERAARNRKILELRATGLKYEAIAHEINVSSSTVAAVCLEAKS